MSAWRRRLRVLYELGPGRHPATKFDLTDLPTSSARYALQIMLDEGYATKHVPTNLHRHEFTYSITKLGSDMVEGRAAVQCTRSMNGQGCGRGKNVTAATWLASLPRRNEITLRKEIT